MSGDFQRVPFVRSIQESALRKAQQVIEITGKNLPATVKTVMIGCVEVQFAVSVVGRNFPTVVVPMGGAAGSQFIRVPVQVGTKGWVKAADARLGGMSGLGATNTDLTPPANLSALVFEPIGNVAWPAMEDVNQLELMGQDGVLIKSTANKEWYGQWTTTGVTISNKAGTASISWNGTAWEIKGPVMFDSIVTMEAGLALSGNITAPGGGTLAANILTTGNVEAGVGGADHVTLQLHQHSALNSPPTPGH